MTPESPSTQAHDLPASAASVATMPRSDRLSPRVTWREIHHEEQTPEHPLALLYHLNSRRARINGHVVGPEQAIWEPGPEEAIAVSHNLLPLDHPARITLPEPDLALPSAHMLRNRRSTRTFSDRPLSLDGLASVLWHAHGVTATMDTPHGAAPLRTAPSGGGRYPIEVYVVAQHINGLAPGSYHYRPETHDLEPVTPGDHAGALVSATLDMSFVAHAACTIILSATWDRTMAKYGERGYRNALMEAGAVVQNVYLGAAALGLGTVALDGIDAEYDALIGADGLHESALIAMPLGTPEAPA